MQHQNGEMQLYMKQPGTGTVVTLSRGQGMQLDVPYVCVFACSAAAAKMYMPLNTNLGWATVTYPAYNPSWEVNHILSLGFQSGGSGFTLHEVRVHTNEFHTDADAMETCARLQEKWAAS